jgi:hypothetical protein
MKKLSNMMLAAVAAAAIATPAMAWDFSASGSTSAAWKQQTVAPATGSSTTTANFSGSSGAVTLTSANADGDNTVTFSYTADVDTDGSTLGGDTGLDQTVKVAGSTKVGNWTTTGTASQSIMEDGVTAKISADDSANVAVSDGTMTITLGDSAHLSTAEKVSVADSVDGEQDAEARVDGFQGVSVAYKVDDATSVTFAIDMHSTTDNTTSMLGDNAIGAAATSGAMGQVTAFGLNVSTSAGGADVSFTYGSGSNTAPESNTVKPKGSGSTMGLGVAFDAGAAVVALDYEATNNNLAHDSTDIKKSATTGYEVSVNAPVGDDSVVLNISSTTTKDTVADTEATTAGTALEYTTSVGAATLRVGYGSSAVKDGATTTQLAVKMAYSF